MTKNADIDVFREVLNELLFSLNFAVENEKLVVRKTVTHLHKF